VPVLVADADGDRNRHDAAEHGGPEGIDELFVAAQEEDELVAGARAELLEMREDAERPTVQVGEADGVRIVLAGVVRDGPVHLPVLLHQFVQRRRGQRLRADGHQAPLGARGSSRMKIGRRVRRLISASNSIGSRGSCTRR
jgi:hypothetical protein